MASATTGERDARVGTFLWTPATGELRSLRLTPRRCSTATRHERPLLTRVVAQLHRDDIDRLHDVMRDVGSRGDAQSVESILTTRDGAIRRLRGHGEGIPACRPSRARRLGTR